MGHGYSAYARKAAEELKAAEDSIRNNAMETAIAINKKGERVLDKSDGNAREVHIDLTYDLIDSILTHNHPSGNTFSWEDLDVAFRGGVREMRACHANGYYSLRRTWNIGDNIPYAYQHFARDYRDAASNFVRTVTDLIWNKSKQTEADATRLNAMVFDFRKTWLRNHAKAYGWEYTEGGK